MSNIFISSNEIAAIEGVIPVLGTDKSCCVLVSHLGGGAASVSKVMSSVRLAVGEAAAGIAKVSLPPLFSPPPPLPISVSIPVHRDHHRLSSPCHACQSVSCGTDGECQDP